MAVSDEIARLREGSMLDYDMQTWEVTGYEAYDAADSPADVWTLESGADVLFLEHEYDSGDVFRLFEPARVSDVSVDEAGKEEPFLTYIRQADAPGAIGYEGDEYVLTEKDARVDTEAGLTKVKETSMEPASDGKWTRSANNSMLMGVCGGIAEREEVSPILVRIVALATIIPLGFLAIIVYFVIGLMVEKPDESDTREAAPAPATIEDRTHYWVYETNGKYVALECHGYNDWDAYAGREVEPHEFDNFLPGASG
jgi:phage shock protein PspC (stress-responsive transcriptional regulator)